MRSSLPTIFPEPLTPFYTRDVMPGVRLIQHSDSRVLARLFMRAQEYYESPYGNIRGHFFTVEEFVDTYCERRGCETFTYLDDWTGFNVPIKAIEAFNKSYSDPWAIGLVRMARGAEYVIGARLGAEDAINHELSHAMWATCPQYVEAQRVCLVELSPEYRELAERALLSQGYCADVIDDEIVAYMSTGVADWFPPAGRASEPFSNVFKHYKQDLWNS